MLFFNFSKLNFHNLKIVFTKFVHICYNALHKAMNKMSIYEYLIREKVFGENFIDRHREAT